MQGLEEETNGWNSRVQHDDLSIHTSATLFKKMQTVMDSSRELSI